MSSDHATSERVYARLKQDILGGRLGAAGQLNIAWLAREHRSSATPVREALLRLVGEQLVDLPVTGGFGLIEVSDRTLADLYDLNRGLMLLALDWTGSFQNSCLTKMAEDPTDAAGLFSAIAEQTGNGAFRRCVNRLNEQLAYARLAEANVFADLQSELLRLKRALRNAGAETAKSSLTGYHERRLDNVAQINQARRGSDQADRPPR